MKDVAQNQKDVKLHAARLDELEKVGAEAKREVEAEGAAYKRALEEGTIAFKEDYRLWFVNAVNHVHQDAFKERRSSYENSGGKMGGWQLQQVAPEAVWFMAVLFLAVDNKPRVSVTVGGGEPVFMDVIYEGTPHTDTDYQGAQLVYWVFASRTPFPEGGVIEVVNASLWSRTYQGSKDMSLRACLRALRDLFDICAGCNDKVREPPCQRCRFKGERAPSPRFSPSSPGSLRDGVSPLPGDRHR